MSKERNGFNAGKLILRIAGDRYELDSLTKNGQSLSHFALSASLEQERQRLIEIDATIATKIIDLLGFGKPVDYIARFRCRLCL